MERSLSGHANQDVTVPEESDVALAKERSGSDLALEQERKFLDTTLSETLKTSQFEEHFAKERELLDSLRSRIRGQRRVLDQQRSAARVATDEAVRSERSSHRHEVRGLVAQVSDAVATSDLEGKARANVVDEQDADRRDLSQKLWLALPEIDTILTAIEAIRIELGDRPPEEKVVRIVAQAELATSRILDLLGDLLDPRDSRKLYNEIGGSG